MTAESAVADVRHQLGLVDDSLSEIESFLFGTPFGEYAETKYEPGFLGELEQITHGTAQLSGRIAKIRNALKNEMLVPSNKPR